MVLPTIAAIAVAPPVSNNEQVQPEREQSAEARWRRHGERQLQSIEPDWEEKSLNSLVALTEKKGSSSVKNMANHLQHRGGLDFFALARGSERSYSTSFLINLDPDLMALAAPAHLSTYDLYMAAIIGHTQRIFSLIQSKSKRVIDQFCFGSTYVQMNPNFRKFERMDPMTWKKEGIASRWTGVRGYRKKCCKNCCEDVTCNGCGVCKGCLNSPVRGNYDGLVVLTIVTKETLPNYANLQTVSLKDRRQQEKLLDFAQFVLALEYSLTSHFMYGGDDLELQSKCVPSARMAVSAGEAIDEGKSKTKKVAGYALYVAYRLMHPAHAYTHNAKISKHLSVLQQRHHRDQRPQVSVTSISNGQLTEDALNDEDDEQRTLIRSRDASPSPQGGGGGGAGGEEGFGTGAYDIEDIDDFEYGRGVVDELDEPVPEIEEDEKLLEDLEDKQLRERIANLETEHSNIKEQVWKLEHGKTWMESRLEKMESDISTLKDGDKKTPEES